MLSTAKDKIIKILFAFCIISFLFSCTFAKTQVMSPLPTPTQEVLNISVKKCSKSCLKKLFDMEYYFSFIALYGNYNDDDLRNKFQIASAILDTNILPPSLNPETGVRVALLIPQKNIGRYSITSADSILLYLVTHGDNFEFKVFNSQNEEADNVRKAYQNALNEKYDFVVAILTPKGMANLLRDSEMSLPLFIPTIHKKNAGQYANAKNVFFGGIDYEKQIDMMVALSSSKNAPIISLDDDGVVGKMLGNILKTKSQNIIAQESIDSKKSNDFKPLLQKIRTEIRKSMIVLNTSVIKSGLIVPQIGNTKNMPIAFLSSQINYNLSLLSLIPKEDTQKIFIVNAIGPLNPKLLAFNELLNSDLQYDWVNYATALAIDILLSQGNKNSARFFHEKLDNNQVQYNDRFYGVKDSHFIPVKLK